MTARDPRVDPRPGDWVSRKDTPPLIVKKVDMNYVWYINSHPSSDGSYVRTTRDQWRSWAISSTIIQRGSDDH